MSAPLTIRRCESLPEYDACVALQRKIWREADLEIAPSSVFVVASLTGGEVLGAFQGDELVGYALAVAGLGRNDGGPYLHSHMLAVHPDHQCRGIGRELKLFQRQSALARGIRRIEWTFDPLELTNAHFNLNRLGAICKRLIPDFYGITTSPLHRGLATDRLLAEWHLDSARVRAAIGNNLGPAPSSAKGIQLPADLGRLKEARSPQLPTLQTRLREQFSVFFSQGYAATAVNITTSGAEYVLSPQDAI
ncbi:MAG TPA: GNAT family N-acetyltransferase [Candidatus Acidoferrum sp.]|jgi:predicted GNAT superfamily acetyltransferase